MPALPNPLGLASLPVEVAGALRVVPRIAERLDAVVEALGALGRLDASIGEVHTDTSVLRSIPDHTASLPALNDQMGEVARATETLPVMDGRMANIEAAMPALLEVQGHLA